METINHKRVRRNFVIILVLLFMLGMFYRYGKMSYRENQLLNNHETHAKIIKYSSVMGANYIHYEYKVENEIYQWSEKIEHKNVDTSLINNEDLRILYAIEDPSISTLIDSRFK